jgi:ribonuclease BN (tRNA processing enzyme)
MKLTVLGKYGPYPSSDGACSSYLLEAGGKVLLMDAGSGSLSRLYKFTRPEKLDGIILSHFHFDHVSDLLPMRYALEIAKAKVNLYVADDGSELYNILKNTAVFEIINIAEDTKIEIGAVKLSFFEVKHPVKNHAVRVSADEKVFVYSGDTLMCDGLLRATQGADTVLADCCQPSFSKAPHMTVDDAIKLQESFGGRLIATHQSPSFEPTEFFDEINNIEVAIELQSYFI